MATFHVHHHSDRHTTSNPFSSRSSCVAYRRHITSLTVSNQHRSCVTQRVAIVSVKVWRSSTTSFITEEVVLSSKFTNILAFFFPCSQLSSYHFRQQFFSFDQWNLNVSVRVTIQSQLTGNTFRQTCIDSRVFRRKFADDIITLVRFLNLTEFFSISSQEVIQFSNQTFHGRNELYQSFRNQNCTEVVSLCCTVCYHFSDRCYYIVQRHIFCFHFFWNDTYVRLYLQSTFQCDVRSRTTHQLDEVPVFTCRVTVTLDVTDYFSISLTSCIETERSFNHIVLQVTVNCFRATDYLYTILLSSIVFS